MPPCPMCGAPIPEKQGRGRRPEYDRPECRELAAFLHVLSEKLDAVNRGGIAKANRKTLRRELWTIANQLNREKPDGRE